MVHYCDATSICFWCSVLHTQPVFKTTPEPLCKHVDDSLALKYKLFMNDTWAIKKANQHAFDLRLNSFLLLFWSCRGWSVPWHALALGFWVILEDPCFITTNNLFQKMRIIFSRFQEIVALLTSDLLLILRKIIGNYFCADFPRAQFFHQNLLNDFGIQIQPLCSHSDTQPAIDLTRSRTLSKFSTYLKVENIPLPGLSSIDSLSSENALNHRKTWALDRTSSL